VKALAWALAAALAMAWAQDDVPGAAAPDASQSALVARMRETLQNDPAVADSLAGRIQGSSLAGRISGADDGAQRLRDIRRWISDNPETAARVAVGLAQDDAQGNHAFEEAVQRNTSRNFAVNKEHVRQSTYGRLKQSSAQSKLMDADERMTDEEKREILKSMFEGQGGMSNQIITREDSGRPAPPAGAMGPAAFSAGYYDRLSRLNLRGYSPQVVAIQNALNGRRVPGAPKLIETGKLDYETLSYPAYAMRYDLRNLETRLRYQRNFELARRSGMAGQYTPDQLITAEVGALLEKKAGQTRLPEAFAKRQSSLDRATAAIREFAAAAAPAQDPSNLSRGLLLNLGARQKEAARWITIASLEEEIQRLDGEAAFLSPDLLELISSCPLPEPTRQAYRRRGEAFHKTLLKMRANAERSARRLEADDWLSAVAEVESALAENALLRRNLSRDILNYVGVPYRLRSLHKPQPRWRNMLEDAARRYLPSSRWGRRLRRRREERAVLKDAFNKIATGDLDAAHSMLAACESSAQAAQPR